MKKTMSFTIALMFTIIMAMNSNLLIAQPQMPSAEEMAKQETESMKTAIGLTGDLLTKAEAINLKYAKQTAEMFSQGPGGDFSVMQTKMTEIATKKRAEFAAILSDEQMKKYDELAAQQQNRQGPPM